MSSPSALQGTAKQRLRLADLPNTRPTRFLLEPTRKQADEIARTFGLIELRKLRFEGNMRPRGKSDWLLSGHLGASVVQPCVISLAPVTSRLEEDVTRQYLANWQDPEDNDIEMPEDDTAEPLPATLDLLAVAQEALALALPLYPRADDARLEQSNFAGPGIEPLCDDDVKPFASLGALRKKISGSEP